jgi:hypothetical protein
MASPNKISKQFPLPETSQLPGFLATCPTLAGVDPQELELLASELQLVRYEDGARFFADETPDHNSPLRFVVQGRASWDTNRSAEQKGAWMMSPGSVFGLEAVNDWAKRHELTGVWSRGEMPRIRCQAIGVVWVMELPADRFDSVFLPEQGRPALAKLLRMVPTVCHAPDIVASMRGNSQFARAATVNLYKLLEWAPTTEIAPLMPLEPGLGPVVQPGPAALYYVIEGELTMTVADETKSIHVGEMDGADLFMADAKQVSMPIPLGEAAVVVLTRQAIETCIRYVPGFARTLGPRDAASKAAP